MGFHYVPQQYLRGFEVSDDPGTIWTYDKIPRRFAKIPIKVVAQEGPRESLVTVQARPSLVKEANRRVASGAERFLFSHERGDWIATLANKPHPFLSRIQW